MGKEIKIGLAITGLLLGVFTIVLGIRLWNSDTPRAAGEAAQAESDEQHDAEPAAPVVTGRRRPITVAADDANQAGPDHDTTRGMVDPWSQAARGTAPSDPGLDYMPDPQQWMDDDRQTGRYANRYADYVSPRIPDVSEADDIADTEHQPSDDGDGIGRPLDEDEGFAADGAALEDDPGEDGDLSDGVAAAAEAADAEAADAMEMDTREDAARSQVAEAEAGDARSTDLEGAGVGEPDPSNPLTEPPHGAYFDTARQHSSRHRDTAAEVMPAGSSAAPVGRMYAVQEGDTLFGIARVELGKASRWAEIYDLNRDQLGEGLNDLSPGMQLVLPADERAGGAFTSRPRRRRY